jgi:hypothetical protein
MDKESIVCFRVTLGGAKFIYRTLREREVPPYEALESIDDRIALLEDDLYHTKFQCTVCKKKFNVKAANSHLDNIVEGVLDWYYEHECKGPNINLRR